MAILRVRVHEKRCGFEPISKLLSNEKYIGSALLQKTLSICGAQFKNDGELERVLPREVFIGIESGYTQIRKMINKPGTP